MKSKNTLPVSPSNSALVSPRGLRVGDAANYAGTSHWHIRTAVWTGKLKARRAGKVLLILRDDLDQYLDSLPEVQPSAAEWLNKRQAHSS